MLKGFRHAGYIYTPIRIGIETLVWSKQTRTKRTVNVFETAKNARRREVIEAANK